MTMVLRSVLLAGVAYFRGPPGELNPCYTSQILGSIPREASSSLSAQYNLASILIQVGANEAKKEVTKARNMKTIKFILKVLGFPIPCGLYLHWVDNRSSSSISHTDPHICKSLLFLLFFYY